MITLLLIGFLGGLVTGISPCILPVLPVIFAAGASGGIEGVPAVRPAEPAPRQLVSVDASGSTGGGEGEPPAEARPPFPARSGVDRGHHARRPLSVVAGLVLSFSLFTLIGSWLLGLLGLPQDALRWIGLVVLGLVGLGLMVPVLGQVLERPFVRLSAGQHRTDAGGFALGLSLGLVFVPCAGPVLAAIDTVGADHRFGWSAVILTLAFAVGVAVPLSIFAVLGQRLAERMHLVRSRAALARKIIGAVLVLTALVIGLNLTDGLQQALPGYTNSLQTHIEGNASAKQALDGVTGEKSGGVLASCTDASPVLQECGAAPEIVGISQWLNTPGDRPLSIARLRGRVVLVDFWTYSCINCQRSLPHVEAWNRAYAKDGLTVIGVHTPEFAFEHVTSNVRAAAGQLGVHYPIALDNNYSTWNAFQNNYWPAEYLIDATGQIRHVDYGEGQYSQTETFIRHLLTAANPAVVLPARTDVVDATPTEATTPETYLGYQHGVADLVGESVQEDQMTRYPSPASLPQNGYGYGGSWRVGGESSTAGPGATLSLNFEAKDVYLVLGGAGTVGVSVNGKPGPSVTVAGEPKLYRLVSSSAPEQGLLTLSVSPGVQAYDFTFG